MEKLYTNTDFETAKLECEKCGWKGEGSDAIIIDLYGVTDTSEIHCPECDAYLGGLKTSE